MSEINSTAVEAIKMAIQMEKDGRAFYEDTAQKTENELGKKMFETLAKDEITHLQTFQKMFDTITGTGDWREIAQQYSPKIGKVPIFEEEIERKTDVKPGELDALRIAMDNERKSIDYYNKVTEETEDPLAKEIFTKIIEEEKYHYDLLQAQRDYLFKSGFWFDIAEFRMDAKY